MTQHPDLFAALAAEFEPGEVKVRTQSGRQFHYITARTVMNRLDAVLGPENWWDRYAPAGEHSVLCRLTIRLPDGTTLTKCDAGGCAGMADQGDDDKSAYSDAFKRAAVKFGVARYLYDRDAPVPAPAPEPEPRRNGAAYRKQRDQWGGGRRPDGAAPRTAAPPPAAGPKQGLWHRLCHAQKTHRRGKGLVDHVVAWGRDRGYPERIRDWVDWQVAEAEEEARAYLEGEV